MPKVKIEEQPSYPFSVELEVRVSDLNYGAHLGYDRILGLAHQARLVLLGELGVDEMDLGDGRTGVVAVDVAATYLGEAFVNDVLVFAIRPVEVGRVGFRLAHLVVNKQAGAKVALIEIGFVGYDYTRRRPAGLPEAFRQGLAALDRDGG
jgi:acyl-CoA thioesterase FadM